MNEFRDEAAETTQSGLRPKSALRREEETTSLEKW